MTTPESRDADEAWNTVRSWLGEHNAQMFCAAVEASIAEALAKLSPKPAAPSGAKFVCDRDPDGCAAESHVNRRNRRPCPNPTCSQPAEASERERALQIADLVIGERGLHSLNDDDAVVLARALVEAERSLEKLTPDTHTPADEFWLEFYDDEFPRVFGMDAPGRRRVKYVKATAADAGWCPDDAIEREREEYSIDDEPWEDEEL